MNEDRKIEMRMNLPYRICDVVKPWAERSPDQPAVVEAGGSWSYRQLDSVVAETRARLIDLGVRPGDRVMIVCENCRAFVAVLLAVAALDAWPVLVNASLSAAEIGKIRNHCNARRVIYTTGASANATERARLDHAVIEEVGNLGQIGIGPLNQEVAPETVDIDIANNVAALIYTSGTTGVPKGVMLTHRNLLFLAATSAKIRTLTPQDRLYGVLPMSHAVGPVSYTHLVENARKVAEFLRHHRMVDWVNYAGFPDNPLYPMAHRYLGSNFCSLLTFGVKGGFEAGTKVFNAFKLFKRMVNMGDAKSLSCHPASTTHRQLTPAEQAKVGVTPEMILSLIHI